MKKNFKRNKILLTSLIGLAVVASASVAFSTWIFGLNKDKASIEGIEVTVDGYKDTTKYIDIAAAEGETIRLAEYSAITSSADKVASATITTEYKPADFEIKLDKFEVAYSKDQFDFKDITFTLIAYKDGDATFADINKVAAGEIHGEAVSGDNTVKMRDAKTGSDQYEYLSLATATIGKDDLTTWFKDAETIGSYTYYNVLEAKKTLSLKWSDYFGSDSTDGTKASPATFYNAKYKAEYVDDSSKTIKDKLQFLNTANSEMDAMTNKFKDVAGIKIKITATLNVTDITTGK